MKKTPNRTLCLILSLLLLLPLLLTGCAEPHTEPPESLTDNIPAGDKPTPDEKQHDPFLLAQTEFAIELLRRSASEGGENVLVSPLSVSLALAMTANGAAGQTLDEMQAVLGGTLTLEQLNAQLCAYADALPTDKKTSLSIANAIWLRDDTDRLTVNDTFLQTAKTLYDADAYRAPFDGSTVKDINNWVNDKTDGMIKQLLDEIPAAAIMYLVNALAFDAEWARPYETTDEVRVRTFTPAKGTGQQVEFLCSGESIYLSDEGAVGVAKPYAGGKYQFVALLPDEGTTPEQYLATLTPERLRNVLENPIEGVVVTQIPKFETEFTADLAALLCDMGMPTAFDGNTADFSPMATSTAGNIFISRVLHKTYISVAERGTRAAAVTAVEMTDGAAPINGDAPKPYYVILNRPFLYMIVDTEHQLPLFFGIVSSVK